jgi:hypothetical protein
VAEVAVLQLLKARLPARHATAAVGHFRAAVLKYQERDWEVATAKAGKFVEAVLKALADHANVTPPKGRGFSVDAHINALAQAPGADDTVRLTIPRACRFIYDVASNRGARHDPAEIDPNEMDATTTLNLSAWVLAELLRYSQRGGDLAETAALVGALMQRRYPFIEEVDGRVYFHVPHASARDIALLTLWRRHPRRVSRQDLVEAAERHGFKPKNANMGVTRLGQTVDDDGQGRLRLLVPGMREADRLIGRAQQRDGMPR